MRVVQHQQMSIGEVDIAHIKFDPKSRDDIPRILRGLQHLYLDTRLRNAIFELLAQQIAPTTNKAVGRPGMTLWRVLVCGVLRLDLNIDYDRLHELVNNHNTIRQMLGHAAFDGVQYHHQSLKDNVRLLTPELLEQINVLVVRSGHGVVKKKATQVLHGRCDSFVVETHVHYPTDINLLLDALRKIITLSAQWCELRGLSDWHQARLPLARCQTPTAHSAEQKALTRPGPCATSQKPGSHQGEPPELPGGGPRHRGQGQTNTKQAGLAGANRKRANQPYQRSRPLGVKTRSKALSNTRCARWIRCSGASSWARASRMRKRCSPCFSHTPSGSAKARPGCRWSWGLRSALCKTSTSSYCTIRSCNTRGTSRYVCRWWSRPECALPTCTAAALTKAFIAQPTRRR